MTDGLAKLKQLENLLALIKQNIPLIKRVGSALVLAPLAIFCIFHGGYTFLALALAAAVLTSYEWYKMVKGLKAALALILLGLIYISVSYASFIFIRFGFDDGAWLALIIMLCVWSSDIMAYLFGKSLQGPKLCPLISPNKTWAGLVGSMVGFTSVLIASFVFIQLNLQSFPFYALYLIGPLLGVAAQGGDLLVSILKRKAGIKDTGKLIPGHGGILDRIDALMLIMPLSALLLLALQG